MNEEENNRKDKKIISSDTQNTDNESLIDLVVEDDVPELEWVDLIEDDVQNISEDELSYAVESAKEMMRNFVENVFGEKNLNKILPVLEQVAVKIDKDPKIAEQCNGYFDGEVYLTETFCEINKNSISMLSTIMHEYAHAFSRLISNGMLLSINPVIEEAFADLFAEMCFNFYIQYNQEISYLSGEQNTQLQQNGYINSSYIKEGDFTRSILYALKCQGRDLIAIQEYFFGKKENFIDICTEVLGDNFYDNVLGPLENVTITIGTNNASKYLPQPTKQLKEILDMHFQGVLGSECIDYCANRKLGNLYAVNTPILKQIYCDRQMQYEWTGKELDLENLNIEDLNKLYKRSNGIILELCQTNGYSNFVKKLISSWYNQCEGNLEKFDEILKITGGIPLEQLFLIIEDRGITNLNDILQLYSKYHIMYDKENYRKALEYLMQNSGSKDYEDVLKFLQDASIESDAPTITDQTCLALSYMNLDEKQFKELILFYGKTPHIMFTSISPETLLNICNIFSILANQDLDNIPPDAKDRYCFVSYTTDNTYQ